MKQDDFEKLKQSQQTYQEIVDSKHESPLVPLIYADNRGYNPINFFFLVVNFGIEVPEIKAINIQMHELINKEIFFSDTKLLRTSERTFNNET